MSRIYLTKIESGLGPSGRMRHRPAAMAHPHNLVSAYAIETLANGNPAKAWTVCVVDADDYAPFDSDPKMLSLADLELVNLIPNAEKRGRINGMLASVGATARAKAGESYRTTVNQLLAELGTVGRI